MDKMEQWEEYCLCQMHIVMKPLNPNTECTFKIWLWNFQSIISLCSQSFKNNNLDIKLFHNHFLPYIVLLSWYKAIHIDKLKIWQQFMAKTLFLPPSKCDTRDGVQIPELFWVCWKIEESSKCIKMKAKLIIKGSVLHATDATEHTLQMSFM